MRYMLVAAGLLLAGCNLFSPPPEDLVRPGATQDQNAADLAGCRQQALAVIDRERGLNTDISVAQDIEEERGELEEGLDELRDDQRLTGLVEECMRARGYQDPAGATAP